MNRFEALEKIFKDEGNFIIDGRAMWKDIKRLIGDTGAENQIEFNIFSKENKKYLVEICFDQKITYYIDDEVVEPCDEYDYVDIEIHLTEIMVSRPGYGSDEHTFYYRFN